MRRIIEIVVKTAKNTKDVIDKLRDFFLNNKYLQAISVILTLIVLCLAIYESSLLQETTTPNLTGQLVIVTEAPTATIWIPTPTIVVVPAPIPTATPVSVFEPYGFFLERSHEAFAVCALESTLELSAFVLKIGPQTRYELGQEFTDSSNLLSGQCKCLQLDNARFPNPQICNVDNTTVVDRVSEWRNEDIEVILSGNLIGNCSAEPTVEGTYLCR